MGVRIVLVFGWLHFGPNAALNNTKGAVLPSSQNLASLWSAGLHKLGGPWNWTLTSLPPPPLAQPQFARGAGRCGATKHTTAVALPALCFLYHR